jgi:hypothetical protein
MIGLNRHINPNLIISINDLYTYKFSHSTSKKIEAIISFKLDLIQFSETALHRNSDKINPFFISLESYHISGCTINISQLFASKKMEQTYLIYLQSFILKIIYFILSYINDEYPGL